MGPTGRSGGKMLCLASPAVKGKVRSRKVSSLAIRLHTDSLPFTASAAALIAKKKRNPPTRISGGRSRMPKKSAC
jgi:hypothetical protein